MGSDHDSLISQALFSFARLNGYSVATPAPAKAPRVKAGEGLAADQVAEWEPPFGPSHPTPPARTKAIVPPLPPPSPAPVVREAAEVPLPVPYCQTRTARGPSRCQGRTRPLSESLPPVPSIAVKKAPLCHRARQTLRSRSPILAKVSREHAAVVNQGGHPLSSRTWARPTAPGSTNSAFAAAGSRMGTSTSSAMRR